MTSTDRAAHFIACETSAQDEERVVQTENGSTFFLITRQEDFPTKPKPSPQVSIDSLCSPAATLSTDQKIVIRYISSVWLPEASRVQPDRFFGSFSLVWPGDDQYANVFLSAAFQTSDARSIYALLAAAARKMMLGGKLHHHEAVIADLFSLKAVQALRGSLSRQDPFSDQLVLDLTFLVLAELYARPPHRIAGVDTYWEMMRRYITSIGGMCKMRPVVVYFVTSIDALCSFTGVTLPKLDVRQDHQLLGLHPTNNSSVTSDNKQDTIEADIKTALARLDLRSQIINETVHMLTQLISAIQTLPHSAVTGFRAYLGRCLPQAVTSITSPLCPHFPQTSLSLLSLTDKASIMTAADTAHSFARLYANVMWWRYTATTVCFLPSPSGSTDQSSLPLPPPSVVQTAVSQAWHLVDQVHDLLQGEMLYTPSDMSLWIGVLGCHVLGGGSGDHGAGNMD